MAARRYRAFLSYSRQDAAAGGRLFRKLESYQLPRTLRQGGPKRDATRADLRPIYRDRHEPTPAADLPSDVQSALMEAEDLIILCSPSSAGSGRIRAEIAYFRHLGRGRRIHPVLLEGEPEEALPQSLQSAEGGGPVAADLRPLGDGWSDGLLKVIAAAQSIPYADLKKHDSARARRKSRVRGTIAAALGALAVYAGVASWSAVQETRVDEPELNLAEAALLTAVASLGDVVESVGANQKEGAMLNAIVEGALTRTTVVADGLASLKPESMRLQAETAWLRMLLAERRAAAGDEAQSEAYAAEAQFLYAAIPNEDLGEGGMRLRAAALDERGEALLRASLNEDALALFQEGADLRRLLADRRPQDASAARDLMAALARNGDLLLAEGRRDDALSALLERLAVARRITENEPRDDGHALALAAALDRTGDLLTAAGRDEEAVDLFRESVGIRRRLLVGDPKNAGLMRGLAANLCRTGEALEKTDRSQEAIAAYRECVEARRGLLALRPTSGAWALELALSLTEAGDAYKSAGDLDGAVVAYRESIGIRRRLAAQRHTDAGRAREVAAALETLGDILAEAGRRDDALAALQESLEIRRALLAARPEDVRRVEAAYRLLLKISAFLEQGEDRITSAALLAEALEQVARLRKLDPGERDWANEAKLLKARLQAMTAQNGGGG